MKLLFPLIIASTFAAVAAEPLREATIQQIINQVRVLDLDAAASHAAQLKEKITAKDGVKTGISSRAELLFHDQTIARLGAETFFTFKPGSRDIRLDSGTLLLQVPKNQGGARIRSGSVSASVTGTTVLMEHLPRKNLRVMVLEGHLRLSVPGRFGEALTLKPGEMIVMDPASRTLPDPVEVDIAAIARTSRLIAPPSDKKGGKGFRPLPSAKLIEQAAAKQAAADGARKKKGSSASAISVAPGAPLDVAAQVLTRPAPASPAPAVTPPRVVTPSPAVQPAPPAGYPHSRPGIGGSK